MANKITTIIFCLIVSAVLALLLTFGLRKQDIADCYKWQEWSETYKDFYWTDWQVEQCKDILSEGDTNSQTLDIL